MPTSSRLQKIEQQASVFMELGVKPSDAIHLASAKHAECDWFLTVDRGILKKVNLIEKMRVANPLAFIQEMNP